MLYKPWLLKYEKEVDLGIKNLFEKAFKNQSDENDLLLVILNGHKDRALENNSIGLSPFVFGLGKEGHAEGTQYDFFHYFRKNALTSKEREEFLAYCKKEGIEGYELNVQLELLVYLKFWESDSILKQLYNLANNLLHGRPYDWFKDMRSTGRKHLMENQIINASKNRAPHFHNIVSTTYDRQIRNAVAHSQYFIMGDTIMLNNYDEEDGHLRHSLKISDWEVLLHKTILFYNSLIKYRHLYQEIYKEETRDKHFGKKVKIYSEDRNILKEEWIKLTDDGLQWIWYSNWAKDR